MTTDPAGLAAGWYSHADSPDALRYWDGAKWTDSYAPTGSAEKPGAASEIPPVVSFVGYCTMLLFPVVGFILGIVHLAKLKVIDGTIMVLVSIVSMAVWATLLS